jgi:hypothetical protein
MHTTYQNWYISNFFISAATPTAFVNCIVNAEMPTIVGLAFKILSAMFCMGVSLLFSIIFDAPIYVIFSKIACYIC